MNLPKNFRTLATNGPLVGVLCCFLVTGCGDAASPSKSSVKTSSDDSKLEVKPTLAKTQSDSNEPALTPALAISTPGASETPRKEASSEFDTVTQRTWMEDFEQAQDRAKAEGKDIFVNFTGSDWCGWCIRLHEEVFDHAEFLEYATKHFILLELDFPQDKSHMSEERKTQNEELQHRFMVQGFPTILLADAQGRPYAQTGYQRGGPQAYNEHLKGLVKVRVERDSAFAAAGKLSGVDRAVKLNDALLLVPPQLLLPAYEEKVAEIVRLDKNNRAGLHKLYHMQLTKFKYEKKAQSIVQYVQTTSDITGALQKTDKLESEFSDYREGRLNTNLIRLHLLQLDGRTDEVLKYADSILADKDILGDSRLRVYSAKLSALAHAKRFVKAIEVVEAVRVEFPDNANLSTQLLIARADFLSKLNRKEEGLDSLQEARKHADASMLKVIDQAERSLFPSDDSFPKPSEEEPLSPVIAD